MDEHAPSNPASLIAQASGALAILASGCLFLPLVKYLAVLVVPVLATLAIITGLSGLERARTEGVGAGASAMGLMLAAGALSMSLGSAVARTVALLASL